MIETWSTWRCLAFLRSSFVLIFQKEICRDDDSVSLSILWSAKARAINRRRLSIIQSIIGDGAPSLGSTVATWSHSPVVSTKSWWIFTRFHYVSMALFIAVMSVVDWVVSRSTESYFTEYKRLMPTWLHYNWVLLGSTEFLPSSTSSSPLHKTF